MSSGPIRLTTLAVIAATVAGAITLTAGGRIAEALFGSVVLFALFAVLDHGRRAWRIARHEHARARRVTTIKPATVARDAVVAERRRLADDIAAGLRTSLTAIQARAAAARAAADPSADIAVIAGQARSAAGELRRHLGLLRDPPAPDPPTPAAAVESRNGPDRTDLLIAAVVTAIAVTEAIAYPRIEGIDRSWLSVALTGLAAAIVACRAAPGPACAVVALTYLAAIAFQAPIVGGFWCLATVGGLLWTVAARRETGRRDWACAGLLLLTAGSSGRLLDPDNAALLVVIMVLAVAGGAVVRLARARAAAARARAAGHRRDITEATDTALAAERAAFAREIHDTVSHAVGLIAVQAAAAEVSWPANTAVADQALRVIDDTAAGALHDLDRLRPNPTRRPRTTTDVERLVDRIRATGTPVHLDGLDLIPPEQLDLAYRVVQESLTNVLRHSPGASAAVTVSTGERLEITVTDDGAGPDPAAVRGYGLVGLAERVGFAGGRLDVGRVPTGGFAVHVALPHPHPVPT